MKHEEAPFFAEAAGGPPGSAWWMTTSDDVRIRAAYWPCDNARGTLLLFPGRTEYVEKYGRTAGEFAERGYATIAVDWRGQGLADRLIEDRRVGHVVRFADYQEDVKAVMELVEDLDVPRPLYLLGHSMGGAIGLRAAMDGLEIAACTFTGPMWGIFMRPMIRPMGWALPRVAMMLGMGTRLPPGTRYEPYVLANPFENNMLTTDDEMYRMMQSQLESVPDLALGGPSLVWLREGLTECVALTTRPSPDLPCLTFLGENERIIDTAAVAARMQRWPKGRLEIVKGAEHEVLMEGPAIRGRVLDQIADLFENGAQETAKRA